jgi:hypothetical protein
MQSGAARRNKPRPAPGAGPALVTQERLLAVIDELARELRPRRGQARPVGLDSDLERDLGFDSLGRAELARKVAKLLPVVCWAG